MIYLLASPDCPFKQRHTVQLYYPDKMKSSRTGENAAHSLRTECNITALLMFPLYTAILYEQVVTYSFEPKKPMQWNRWHLNTGHCVRVISNQTGKLVYQTGMRNWVTFIDTVRHLMTNYQFNGGEPLSENECLKNFLKLKNKSSWLNSLSLQQ